MMKKSLCLIIGLAGMVGLACCGCQNTVNTVANADRNMAENRIADSRFITDGFLRDRLVLVSLRTAETSDGLMRMQLEAVNARTGMFSQLWSWMTGENPYPIRYRVTWLDDQGMAMESILSDWQEVQVIPGETLFIQSIAPNRKCKDFRINLQEAK